MFYIKGGELYIVDAARLIPEVSEWEKHYADEPLLRKDMAMYVRYVMIRKDNDYYNLPPMERRRTVVQSMGLFGVDKKMKSRELDGVIRSVCEQPIYAALLKLCDRLFCTDEQRFLEQLREKEEVVRLEYINCTDDKAANEKYRNLTQIQTMKARMEAQINTDDEQAAIEYLFELPDNVMPYHLKL